MIIKWVHVISSTLLFGTGIGSAFYCVMASLRREPVAAYFVVRHVVIADWLFTATSIVIQPLTGFYLVRLAGMSMSSRWLMWSLVLYAIAALCWLPVVWLQMRMRDVAAEAVAAKSELPRAYWRYFKQWFALGFPAFFALLAVFYLMIAKPV